jgi:hypothetical protein
VWLFEQVLVVDVHSACALPLTQQAFWPSRCPCWDRAKFDGGNPLNTTLLPSVWFWELQPYIQKLSAFSSGVFWLLQFLSTCLVTQPPWMSHFLGKSLNLAPLLLWEALSWQVLWLCPCVTRQEINVTGLPYPTLQIIYSTYAFPSLYKIEHILCKK